jgi:hypothetical protein
MTVCAFSLSACGTSSGVADSSAARGTTAPLPTRVTLERTSCYGTCPVYRVAVAEDGAVVFEGLQHVDSVGRFTARIDAQRLAELARAAHEHGYFALDDKYTEGEASCGAYAMDAPTVITSVTTGGLFKRVEHDLGCGGVPRRLYDLERGIDEIAGTSRWIGSDSR